MNGIIRSKNAKELVRQALADLFKEADDNPVLFLSSGGSTLGILDGVDKGAFNSNFTIGVIDERFSADPTINNFLQLKDKLGDVINVNWIDFVPKEKDTLETLAQRMETAWRNWRKTSPNGKIILTIGMGVDGHTAGIFPTIKHPMFNMFNNKWAVGYDAGSASRFPLRITATFEFLRKGVDFAIVYISGEEKRLALEKVLADSGTLAETPARIFREMKNVKIFTDIE